MKKVRGLLILLLSALMLTVFVSCDDSQKQPPVDYTYATFAEVWKAAGSDASKMPTSPIYSGMSAEDLNKFNTAAGDEATAAVADSIFTVTFKNKDILAQKADGSWTFTKYVEPEPDYSWNTFVLYWVASGAQADKMPTNTVYGKMSAEELNAFNTAAGDQATATIADSVFTVTLVNKYVLVQQANGTWTVTELVEPKPETPVTDYSYATFTKAWTVAESKADKMPATPVYGKMSAEELKAFNTAAGDEATAAIADSVFTVTFKNKDVLAQKADGSWTFTKFIEPEPEPEPEPELFPKNTVSDYFLIDLNQLGETFRSGGTYISIEVNGKKILTTKDRIKFEGDGDISLITKGLVANNPSNPDANEYQWGYSAMAIEVQKNVLAVISLSSDKVIPVDATWRVVGLGGHNSGTSAEFPIRPMYFVNMKQLGDTFRAGGTYVSMVVDGKKVLTTKDRFTFNGDGDARLISKGFTENFPIDNSNANKHQWGYMAISMMDFDSGYNAFAIAPMSDDKILNSNTFTLVGLGGHGQSESKPMRITTITPYKALMIDLKDFGNTFRAGGTYVSLVIGDKKILTTRDRFTFDGDESIGKLVESFNANNPYEPDANKHQYGFSVYVDPAEPTKLMIFPDGPNATIDGTTWKLVGLGGHGSSESKEYYYNSLQ